MTILQVPGISESLIAKLQKKAIDRGMTLSTYVRELLVADTEQEPMADVIAQIAARPSMSINNADIIAAIHEGRR